MDLVAALRTKLDSLDDGEYKSGLRSVLRHIETGFAHFQRGTSGTDDDAFTDAIYRSNQAFEGSVKEAYRVLAGHDPARKRPFDIENYMEENGIFRPRVLNQFKVYRTEWRNPSTHDYALDFDGNEALLALVSVTTFACLLLDQISGRIAFDKSVKEAESQKEMLARKIKLESTTRLADRVVALLREFYLHHLPESPSKSGMTEAQILGALLGFVSAAAPDITSESEVVIGGPDRHEIDLLFRHEDERVAVEVKRRFSRKGYELAMEFVGKYLTKIPDVDLILLFVPSERKELFASRQVTQVGEITVLCEQKMLPPEWLYS